MRVSLVRWSLIGLLCIAAGPALGCRGGGTGSPGYLSWTKKQDPAAALAATRPSTQLPPSPTQTVGGQNALTASGAPGNYPTTGAGSLGYPNTNAAADTQKAGYYTGPYGTNGQASGPANGQANGPANGSYGSYATQPAANYSRPANPALGGAAPAGAGGLGGTPNANYAPPAYLVDRRAAPASAYGQPNSPNTTSGPNYVPYGGSNGLGAGSGASGLGASGLGGGGVGASGLGGGGLGAAPAGYANGPGAPSSGYVPSGPANNNGAYGAPAGQYGAPAGQYGAPAGQLESEQGHTHEAAGPPATSASPYASRDGGYRPGSTSRSRPIDTTPSNETDGVRSANLDGSGGSYGGGGSYQPE